MIKPKLVKAQSITPERIKRLSTVAGVYFTSKDIELFISRTKNVFNNDPSDIDILGILEDWRVEGWDYD